SIVCTLFEGHYHFGVAGLINSLYANGFTGEIYIGYRGALPPWAESNVTTSEGLEWNGAQTLHLSSEIRLHFLPVETRFQFTNYKPDFVLQVVKAIDLKIQSSIFYFDPDIVIKCAWQFFMTWVSFGIALVHEIINNDMPASHPVRQMWNEIIVN